MNEGLVSVCMPKGLCVMHTLSRPFLNKEIEKLGHLKKTVEKRFQNSIKRIF